MLQIGNEKEEKYLIIIYVKVHTPDATNQTARAKILNMCA